MPVSEKPAQALGLKPQAAFIVVSGHVIPLAIDFVPEAPDIAIKRGRHGFSSKGQCRWP